MENDKVIKGQSWKRLQALLCFACLFFFFFFGSFSVILLVFSVVVTTNHFEFFTLDVDVDVVVAAVVVIIVVVIVIIYMLFGFTDAVCLFVCLLFLAKRVEKRDLLLPSKTQQKTERKTEINSFCVIKI